MRSLPTDAARRAGGLRPVAETIALLEPSQRTAVLADEPVVCVLAGAGTGKTRVLTLRVARRIEDGTAHPSHVLVCTFSRKAASELRERLWRLGVGGDVRAGTFHRCALALIGQYRAERAMMNPVVLADRRALLQSVLEDHGGSRRTRAFAVTRAQPARTARRGNQRARTELARVEAEISWAKARLIAPHDYEHAAHAARRRLAFPAARVAEIYADYEAARRRRGVLDLDDLLWHAAELLRDDAAFATAVRWWHRHLFVDETQDLNEAQYRLLRLLVGDDPDLFVVGDPNQSVYGWNGADPGLLDRITDEFAGTRVLHLHENHRCSPQVVRLATAALGLSGARAPVSTRQDGPVPLLACLSTDEEEARWVARRVWLAHRPGRHWSSIAVLSRTNAQLTRIAAALDDEHVPYRAAGADLGPASDLSDTEADPDGVDGTEGGDGAGRRALEVAVDAREPTDAVVLSTFHRAKGLQWPAVFVIGLSDGLVPLVTARSAAARAEERRLLYVALTRAEDELTCSWARYADDAAAAHGAQRQPSPWLAAMQDALDDLDAPGPATAATVAEHLAKIRAGLAGPSRAASAPSPATVPR